MKIIGLVKWFNQEKAYGVVVSSDSTEYFLHINSFKKKPLEIAQKMPIVFTPKVEKNNDRLVASNCRMIGHSDDWRLIFTYLEIPNHVLIESTKQSSKQTKTATYAGIIQNSIRYFIKNYNDDVVIKYIIDYFEEGLTPAQLLLYCKAIETSFTIPLTKNVSPILSSVFAYFGTNLNDEQLFEIWLNQKPRYIGLADQTDFEISEKILQAYYKKIQLKDFKRIIQYKYAENFCIFYIQAIVSNLDSITVPQILDIYKLLKLIKISRDEFSIQVVDNAFKIAVETEISHLANNHGKIQNIRIFNSQKTYYEDLIAEIEPSSCEDLKVAVKKILVDHCSDEMKTVLWLNGGLPEVELNTISTYFLNQDLSEQERYQILNKLDDDRKYQLLIQYSSHSNIESAFALLQGFLLTNRFSIYHFTIPDFIQNKSSWIDKPYGALTDRIINYVTLQCSSSEKCTLFFSGLFPEIPSSDIMANIDRFTENNSTKIFKNLANNNELKLQILLEIIDKKGKEAVNWLYTLANEHLSDQDFIIFDQHANQINDEETNFHLWQKGQSKILPIDKIAASIEDDPISKRQINDWLHQDIITPEELSNVLLTFLSEPRAITNREDFFKTIHQIKIVTEYNPDNCDRLIKLNNSFYTLALWHLEKTDLFNFQVLAQKFIYFTPTQQVTIVKRLFYLHATRQFELSVDKLKQLTRFDTKLYDLYFEHDSNLPIDISTDILINILETYQQEKRFSVESELLKAIFIKDLKKNAQYTLSNYFSKCQGRKIPNYNIGNYPKIQKIILGDEFYFAIDIPPFDYARRQAVKKLTGARWSKKRQHWGVPSNCEDEVLQFAREQMMFIGFGTNPFKDNLHLVGFERDKIPAGTTFCEGRLSNRMDTIFNRNFYWCKGSVCYERCESIPSDKPWNSYNLLDFLEILNLSTEGRDNFENKVQNGKYYEFVGLINRLNRLLAHLNCTKCSEILRPKNHGWFTVNNVIRFECVNKSCTEIHKVVYLNHCLNGKCKAVIDSRISKKCSNDLFICKECGTCCSNTLFSNRLKSIDTNDFLDNPKKKWAYDQNKFKFDNSMGHAEKDEYFCYNCTAQMIPGKLNEYSCVKCNLSYEVKKSKQSTTHEK